MINGEEHKAFFTLTGYVSVKKIQAILQEQQKRPDYGGKQGATPTSPPMSIMEALEKGYAQAPSPQEAMQMNVPRLFIIGFILFLLIIIGAVLFEEFFGL